MTKPSQTKEQYLKKLRSTLKEYNVENIDDIIEDYEEYFAHSSEKGYSDAESIQRLPSVRDLARSYDGNADKEDTGSPHSTRARRWSLFLATIMAELALLPFIAVAGLFIICIGAAGLAAFLGGILMLVPGHVLGDITVPRPPLSLLLPTMGLLMVGGMAVFGTTLIIAERSYGALRASILIKRRMLTGKHGDHLKLVPPISKSARRVLYMVVLFAYLAVFAMLLLLTIAALITTGSADFLRSWNI